MGESAVHRCGTAFRCLIADDSLYARKNIEKVVTKIGGEVVGEAQNGREALDLYCRVRPDVVLLDITMPELDGVETLKRILAEDGDAKVIMVTSLGHKEILGTAIGLGAKHYVTKPFDPSHVSLIIKSVIEESHGGEGCATTT